MTRSQMVANVLAVYDQATEGEREYGEQWYRTAHAAAARIGRKHDVPARTVAAVISALSPSNKWHQNIVDAERFVEAYANGRRYEQGEPGASTYPVGRHKAWDILHGMYDDVEDAFLTGTAKKTHAFFLSIARPLDNIYTVTVDGHMYNVARDERTPLSEVPDLNSAGRYEDVSDAVVEASAARGVTPQAMQATTWLVWRRLDNWQLGLGDMLLTTERM